MSTGSTPDRLFERHNMSDPTGIRGRDDQGAPRESGGEMIRVPTGIRGRDDQGAPRESGGEMIRVPHGNQGER